MTLGPPRHHFRVLARVLGMAILINKVLQENIFMTLDLAAIIFEFWPGSSGSQFLINILIKDVLQKSILVTLGPPKHHFRVLAKVLGMAVPY